MDRSTTARGVDEMVTINKMRQSVWLLLFLSLDLGLCADIPSIKECQKSRIKWNGQRAVKVLEKAQVPEGTVHWPDGSKKIGDACVPNTDIFQDECLKATAAIHYYMEGGKKKPIIISDLSLALKCHDTKKTCVCAEEKAQNYIMGPIDGVPNRCLKQSKSIGKNAEECIHTMECKEKLNCIYNANALKELDDKNFKDCGEIEDMRRFCSGCGLVIPVMSFILLPIIVSQASFIFQ